MKGSDDGHAAGSPSVRSLLALVVGLTAAAVGPVAMATAATDRPAAYFTREPVNALRKADCEGVECNYIGVLSNLGVVAWCVGIAASFLFAYLLTAPGRRLRSPFLFAGILTTVLMLDDMFMLHELFPNSEAAAYAAYAVAGVAFAVVFRSFLLRTAYVLPLMSAALFVLSAGVDRLFVGLHLLEDGAKFAGILAWVVYLCATGVAELRATRAPPVEWSEEAAISTPSLTN